MQIILSPKFSFKVPIDAKCISPDAFAGKSLEEIAKLKLWEGNRERNLGDLFHIEVTNETNLDAMVIKILGDVHKVRRIGSGMTVGEIFIQGDAGLHLGEEMKGGKLIVEGDADSWAGAMMKNGIIEIKGNAGDYVGSAYRGSVKGMRGGTIIIHGNAGNEVGCFMRQGLIKIYGNVSQFTGMHMQNGTIFVGGNSEGRDGAEMKGGKIVVCGTIASILPTLNIESVKAKVKINGDKITGPFYLFTGDLTEGGSGKLYVSKINNPNLSQFESLL
jgi:formylmethanofuran dehydrogenase subunit C